MIDKIIQLGKETAIYGLSSVVGRFINFLLVPLYTNFLLPSEYGVVAILYSYIAFLFIVFGFGMDAAYMRFIARVEIGNRKQIFATPLVFLIVTSTALAYAIHASSSTVAPWIGLEEQHSTLVQYGAWILCFDALATVPFASLRMENKALAFASIRLSNIGLNVILNLVFILGMGMKAEGVLLANLIASGLTLVIFLPYVYRRFSRSFSFPLLKEMAKYGFPHIPAGIAGVAMQVIDRPILKALTDDATVGIYQANYKLGIFMMLIVGMFDYAWRPFFLKHAWEENAKNLFARVFTLFLVLMLGIFLLISLFINDLVQIQILGRYLIHPDYWGGIIIVPWILFAYVFNGAYVNFSIGIHIEKKTFYLPYITGLGAASNVVANLMLIPRYGIVGAAIATLICYAVIAGGVYLVSKKLYEVKYEWKKIGFLLGSSLLLFSLYAMGNGIGLSKESWVFRIGIIFIFIAVQPIFGIIRLKDIRELGRRLSFSDKKG